jgi:hypothetical protein
MRHRSWKREAPFFCARAVLPITILDAVRRKLSLDPLPSSFLHSCLQSYPRKRIGVSLRKKKILGFQSEDKGWEGAPSGQMPLLDGPGFAARPSDRPAGAPSHPWHIHCLVLHGAGISFPHNIFIWWCPVQINSLPEAAAPGFFCLKSSPPLARTRQSLRPDQGRIHIATFTEIICMV